MRIYTVRSEPLKPFVEIVFSLSADGVDLIRLRMRRLVRVVAVGIYLEGTFSHGEGTIFFWTIY